MDPELHKDIVSMGMIKDLSINGDKVGFTLELTTPACPFNTEIEQDVRNTIAELGVAELDLKVTARVMEGRAISMDAAASGCQKYSRCSQWKRWSWEDNSLGESGHFFGENRCKGRIAGCRYLRAECPPDVWPERRASGNQQQD